MKLERLPCEPLPLMSFYEEALASLGAICERTWHDRLQLVAEGEAARLWNPDGRLLETELTFPASEDAAPRDSARQVFPGCPLTFRLAEALRPSPPSLRRAILQPFDSNKPPTVDVASRLWHAQNPATSRWSMTRAFESAWHFSTVLLVRCEIQAIDQHWSLRRIVLSLPDGKRDESLAAALEFAQLQAAPQLTADWPRVADIAWDQILRDALRDELAEDLRAITERQQQYLRRELDRVDKYFADYERELTERQSRSRTDSTRAKIADRLAAAKTEREHRRQDQIQRHEIRVHPHLDAVLLLAEPAWKTDIHYYSDHQEHAAPAIFVPRSRQWHTPMASP
jgi:hypothetical protein